MSDDVDVGVQDTSGKKGFSALLVLVIAVFCLLGGYGAGALTGGPVLAVLGLAEEPEVDEEVADSSEADSGPKASDLFQPMEGVFDPSKKRFYAEVGELLIALPYRGATRHLQLTVQLVGHDQKYMKSVENDVPAIRNGLLIFFNQQEFQRVNTYEGRESLRRETLVRVNEIIGATAELRVADVYFTAYITQ
ncbi:MAG: flagellar basal body-associated FliL family protein [Luminiphilus sp.]